MPHLTVDRGEAHPCADQPTGVVGERVEVKHRGGEEAITIRIAGYLIVNELYRVGVVTALRFNDRDANVVKRRARRVLVHEQDVGVVP